MIVTITKKQKYSIFPNGKAVELVVGEVVNYPEWYAEELIERRFAVEGELSDEQVEALRDLDEIENDVDATQKALDLAADNGLDLNYVQGSGKNGRITIDDVRQAING